MSLLIFIAFLGWTGLTAQAQTDSACLSVYQELFEKDEVDFRIVFGYKDARPARFVGDRYERQVVVRHLLSKCTPSHELCGFVRDAEDAELFTKKIKGPDGNSKLIRLRVVQSSAGPDDVANRADPFQTWLSRHAQDSFYEGLVEADLVFYSGHSRTGGGPDFDPPRLGHAQQVDYAWYQKEKPGIGKMKDALKAATHPPRLIGLFSCVSGEHFLEGLRGVILGKKVGFITSERLLYYWDSIQNTMAALNAVLKQECEPAFRKAIRADSPFTKSNIDGFFKN